MGKKGQARAQPGTRRGKRKGVRLSKFAYFLLFLTLTLTAAVVAASMLLKVGRFDITGSKKYSAAQVAKASGIAVGQNLLRLDKPAASGRITSGLPYIESAKISLFPPDTVRIRVQDASVAYRVLYEKQAVLLDERFKVLEVRAASGTGPPPAAGVKLGEPVAGQPAEFKDASQQAALASLQAAITAAKLTVTSIDLSNSYEISVIVEGRIKVLLGTQMDLAKKLEDAAGIIRLKLPVPNKGTLDASEENKRFPYSPGA